MELIPSLFVLVVFCVTSIINVVVILIKIYMKKWDIEDSILVSSWFFGILYTLSTIAETGGIGFVVIHQNVYWVYGLLAISYYFVLWSVRVCLIYGYKKLVQGLHEERYIKYIIMFFVISYLGLNIQFIMSCVYTPGFVDNLEPKCKEIELGIPPTQLTLNTISDIILLMLPVRIVLRSKISMDIKLKLITIFSTVVVLTFVGIMHNIQQYRKDALNELVWSTLEVNVGIIIVSLPLFYKFSVRLLKKEPISSNDPNTYVSITEDYELETNTSRSQKTTC